MEIYKNIDWLKLQYCDKRIPITEIAKLANTSHAQISRYTKRLGLSRLPLSPSKKAIEKQRQTILKHSSYNTHGKISTPVSFNYRNKNWLKSKYQKEKLSMHNIANLCGVTHSCVLRWMIKYSIPRRVPTNKGDENGNYKDGTKLHSGYKLIKTKNHPQAQANGYMREHRLIMEKHLNRYLTANEHIHHKDGNKLNNNINNLELMTNTEHKHYEQSLQLFAKKILFSDDNQFIPPYRNDLLSRFKDFLSKNR